MSDQGPKRSTGREDLAEALHESEERFRSLFSQAAVPMVVTTLDGRLVLFNRAACDFLGYTEAELYRLTVQELAHPDDLPQVAAVIHRLLSGESASTQAEHRFVRKDGSVTWGNNQVSLVRDSAGRPKYLVTTTADVNAYRKAEEALRAQADQLRLITDAAPLLISYVDVQLHYRFVNKAYAEWFGRPTEEIDGRHVRKIIGEAAFRQVLPRLKDALAGRMVTFDTEIPYADGAQRHVHTTFVPDMGEEGEVRGFVGIVADMTERRQAEEAIRRRSEELALLYEAGRLLGQTLDLDRVYDTLRELVSRVMACDSLLVSLFDAEEGLIRCAYAWNDGRLMDASRLPPLPLAPEGQGIQSAIIRTGEPVLIEDHATQRPKHRTLFYANSDGTVHREPDESATRSLLAVPVRLEGKVVGTVQVQSRQPHSYTHDHLRLLEALAGQVAAAGRNAFLYRQAREEIAERRQVQEENARLLREVQAASARQRAFLRDVLASVTDGKLRLCETLNDLPSALPQIAEATPLSPSEGLSELRRQGREAAQARGFAPDRAYDLLTAVGEAGMNAIVHAGGGVARVCASPDSIQVWIEDQGGGIAVENLPRATLEKGFTTAGTLGHGLKMVLQTIDRLWLLTGPGGTTIILEQDRLAPPVDLG